MKLLKSYAFLPSMYFGPAITTINKYRISRVTVGTRLLISGQFFDRGSTASSRNNVKDTIDMISETQPYDNDELHEHSGTHFCFINEIK